MSGRFRHHRYEYSKPFGSARHWWELVGPEGGIHLNVTMTTGFEPTCGLEFHHSSRANYAPEQAPHHIKCPLIGEPCWHDGTTMYATDTIWPMVQPMLRTGDHDGIFAVLEHEYDLHFKRENDE